MAKRSKTTKRIDGVKILTNPKMLIADDLTPYPQIVLNLQADSVDMLHDAIHLAFLSGIAIGRAKATASGKRRKHAK